MAALPPNPLQTDLNKVAEQIVNEWLAELGVKTKFEAASQICRYFKDGQITGRQAIALVKELGYTQAQALRMISLCYLTKLPKTIQTMPRPGTKEYKQMEDAINT